MQEPQKWPTQHRASHRFLGEKTGPPKRWEPKRGSRLVISCLPDVLEWMQRHPGTPALLFMRSVVFMVVSFFRKKTSTGGMQLMQKQVMQLNGFSHRFVA